MPHAAAVKRKKKSLKHPESGSHEDVVKEKRNVRPLKGLSLLQRCGIFRIAAWASESWVLSDPALLTWTTLVPALSIHGWSFHIYTSHHVTSRTSPSELLPETQPCCSPDTMPTGNKKSEKHAQPFDISFLQQYLLSTCCAWE